MSVDEEHVPHVRRDKNGEEPGDRVPDHQLPSEHRDVSDGIARRIRPGGKGMDL